MSDVCVTVSKQFRFAGKKGLAAWLAEGDAPGEEYDGDEWDFSTGGACPRIDMGDRVYVVCEERLVGYAPLTNLGFQRRDDPLPLWRYDGVGFKHFGAGHINFVGTNSPKDFTSYALDDAIVDEHQECFPDSMSHIETPKVEWPVKGMGVVHFIRAGGAVACTIPEKIVGFRGWRYRWWDRSLETSIDLTPWMPAKPNIGAADSLMAIFGQKRVLRDGEPCDHRGCLSHLSHPCEGCGRIGGKS